MVELRALDFGYESKPLFRHAGLKLAPARIYGLLGENGAGKSTLLRLIAGLLFPRSGTIKVGNHLPAKREPAFLADLFVLPENLYLPEVTDRQYVDSLSPFYPGFDHDCFARCLGEFAVPTGENLTSLSLGQQKKFLLSFGLACNVSLLLLDEPTNGLDIPSKSLFRRLVAEALSDDQIFVISTHQVRDVESLIDQIVILHEGTVLFNRDLSEVASKLRISREFRKPDETTDGLLYCEPTIGGYATVWQEAADADAQLDLELLFKAVIEKPDRFSAMFDDDGAAGDQ